MVSGGNAVLTLAALASMASLVMADYWVHYISEGPYGNKFPVDKRCKSIDGNWQPPSGKYRPSQAIPVQFCADGGPVDVVPAFHHWCDESGVKGKNRREKHAIHLEDGECSAIVEALSWTTGPEDQQPPHPDGRRVRDKPDWVDEFIPDTTHRQDGL